MKRLFLATLVAFYCQSGFAQERLSVNGAALGQPLSEFCKSLSGGIYGDPDFSTELLEVFFPTEGYIGHLGFGLFWQHVCRYELLSPTNSDKVVCVSIEFYGKTHEASAIEQALVSKYGAGEMLSEEDLSHINTCKETKAMCIEVIGNGTFGMIRFSVAPTILPDDCYIRLVYYHSLFLFDQRHEEINSLQNII